MKNYKKNELETPTLIKIQIILNLNSSFQFSDVWNKFCTCLKMSTGTYKKIMHCAFKSGPYKLSAKYLLKMEITL